MNATFPLRSVSAPRVLRLAICALLVISALPSVFAREKNSSDSGGAILATTSANGGRLVIKRSPTLGYNVAIAIMIDGKPMGTLRRGQTYEKFLMPGHHTLTASPNRARAAWQGNLNVRAGETYSYTASYNVDELVLTAAAASR